MALKEPFLGLSARQLLAGALAAMTSAWIASAIGVSGTIVGAAVGSFSASVATAFYLTGINRGRTIVTTKGSTVAESDADPDSASFDGETDAASKSADATPRPWARKGRLIIVRTLLALAVALATIGVWELVSGQPFGQAERPAIGRPWQAPATTLPNPDSDAEPNESPAPQPTEPTAPSPEPSPSASPEPEPEPSELPGSEPEPTERTPVE